MIPSVIRDICAYLSDDDLTLTKSSDDGRLNSAINETEVLKRIQRHFFVKVPQVRDWYDFAIEADGEFCPVNIKITNLSTDNLNCKLAVYYTLTGLMPDFPNGIGYLKYFAKLKKDIGANKEKDYYYIIVNKQNTQDLFANSLRGLQSLVSNGNNLPFQCNWHKNREYQERTFEQAKNFILSGFGKSIKLRANAYIPFQKYFTEYV